MAGYDDPDKVAEALRPAPPAPPRPPAPPVASGQIFDASMKDAIIRVGDDRVAFTIARVDIVQAPERFLMTGSSVVGAPLNADEPLATATRTGMPSFMNSLSSTPVFVDGAYQGRIIFTGARGLNKVTLDVSIDRVAMENGRKVLYGSAEGSLTIAGRRTTLGAGLGKVRIEGVGTLSDMNAQPDPTPSPEPLPTPSVQAPDVGGPYMVMAIQGPNGGLRVLPEGTIDIVQNGNNLRLTGQALNFQLTASDGTFDKTLTARRGLSGVGQWDGTSFAMRVQTGAGGVEAALAPGLDAQGERTLEGPVSGSIIVPRLGERLTFGQGERLVISAAAPTKPEAEPAFSQRFAGLWSGQDSFTRQFGALRITDTGTTVYGSTPRGFAFCARHEDGIIDGVFLNGNKQGRLRARTEDRELVVRLDVSASNANTGTSILKDRKPSEPEDVATACAKLLGELGTRDLSSAFKEAISKVRGNEWGIAGGYAAPNTDAVTLLTGTPGPLTLSVRGDFIIAVNSKASLSRNNKSNPDGSLFFCGRLTDGTIAKPKEIVGIYRFRPQDAGLDGARSDEFAKATFRFSGEGYDTTMNVDAEYPGQGSTTRTPRLSIPSMSAYHPAIPPGRGRIAALC